ncbi:myoglobin-like isoform X2 [Babylonia areolata]
MKGWGGEDNPLPDGLIYEGVSDQPLQATAGTAAQSGILQVLDALTGVQHSADKKAFLLKMRSRILPGHQRFIAAVEDRSHGLQNMVKNSANEDLRQAFNSLLSAVVNYRNFHMQMVAKYVVQPSRGQLKKSERGGSELMAFMKDIRDATRRQMVTIDSTD